MTIRSGGRVRERTQARPAKPGTWDDAWQPTYAQDTTSERPTGGRGGGPGGLNGNGSNGWGRRPRRRVPGILKFLAFALVLGAIVVLILATALRPLIRSTVIQWASDNPAALGISFVRSLVEEDLGPKLTTAASADTTQVPFVVNDGDSATAIALRLQQNGFLADRRAFILIATDRGLTQQLNAGTFILRRSMTPDQIVTALLAPEQVHYVTIPLRTGLRLEQITAKLETIDGLKMDPEAFYNLAKRPSPALLADYPWLKQILPAGASLEGFLWPATYMVLPDTTPEELIRDMLDGFKTAVGDRLTVPAARKMSFYEILTLASLVEREAVHDEDRPLIAGVFQNRLNPKLFPNLHLGSDPTIFYIHDTLRLRAMNIADWKTYLFWDALHGEQLPASLPPDLAAYNTTTHQGLVPGPICTPTVASIDAALAPNTKTGYLYFLAKADASGDTVYAKTFKEHQANIAKYGKK
jgi:UPF0755 protein